MILGGRNGATVVPCTGSAAGSLFPLALLHIGPVEDGRRGGSASQRRREPGPHVTHRERGVPCWMEPRDLLARVGLGQHVKSGWCSPQCPSSPMRSNSRRNKTCDAVKQCNSAGVVSQCRALPNSACTINFSSSRPQAAAGGSGWNAAPSRQVISSRLLALHAQNRSRFLHSRPSTHHPNQVFLFAGC